MEGSIRCSANYVPVTPISFLERAAVAYRDNISVVFGDITYTWAQTHQRCIKLASSISQLGVCLSPRHVVAVLAPNVPAMYELHFAVPMSGAVLCTLNTRHDSEMVSTLLKQTEAKLVFVYYQLLDIAQAALEILSKTTTTTTTKLPLLVLISECGHPSPPHAKGTLTYEDLIAKGTLEFEVRRPKDELDPITISSTSGTTANPKSVIYSHRGVYLNALVSIILNEMRHKVTHMGGAPTILNMIINSPLRKPLSGKVAVMTGGAPPPPDVIFKMENLGFNVTHAYGSTEAYGPAAINAWKPEWDNQPRDAKAKLKTRQGVRHVGMEDLDVKDPHTMKSVPADAKTIGEVMFRGNTVMCGYLKNLKATQEAFKGGWFRSGDMGVKHPDGYIELRDRSKDMIICGGESVSSIELEAVIFSHPAVFEASVVGRPDDYWGETPCAFVKLKEGCSATADEIILFCQNRLPPFMAPRTVLFADLPKTSTGKTQKFLLREKAKAMGSFFKKNISSL
ncbi:hypothetical protein JHK87_002647 [Glycine soja]|nr:hypothetical protein JHK87_002647 [Glycine soja]